jgi:hypothetical protein
MQQLHFCHPTTCLAPSILRSLSCKRIYEKDVALFLEMTYPLSKQGEHCYWQIDILGLLLTSDIMFPTNSSCVHHVKHSTNGHTRHSSSYSGIPIPNSSNNPLFDYIHVVFDFKWLRGTFAPLWTHGFYAHLQISREKARWTHNLFSN